MQPRRDAQPANLFAALDHDDPQARVRGRPRRGIPGTATAYHGDIKIKVLARLTHDQRISQAQILFNGQMRTFLKTVWGDLRLSGISLGDALDPMRKIRAGMSGWALPNVSI